MGERASVRSKTTSAIHLSTLPCLILLTVNLRTNRAARGTSNGRPRAEERCRREPGLLKADAADDFLRTASAVAAQHLRKGQRSSRVAALAHDLLLLVCRVRVALLWDYTDVEQERTDGFAPAARGGGLRVSQVQELLDQLSTAAPGARALGLILAGPSLFIVHRTALEEKLRTESANGGAPLEQAIVVAVDASLGEPRACTASERSALTRSLRPLGDAILAAMAPCDDQSSHSSPVALECAGPLLVCVHGWLLEYPVVYCFAAALASGPHANDEAVTSCLGGETLRVHRLSARVRMPGEVTPHQICSFSVPMRLLDLAQEATDADEASRIEAGIAGWEARMRLRLQEAAEWWTDVEVALEDVAHDCVAL